MALPLPVLKELLGTLREFGVTEYADGELCITLAANAGPPPAQVDPEEIAAAKMPSDDEMLLASAGRGN